MDEEELEADLNSARADFHDENIRTRSGFNSIPDPAVRSNTTMSGISAEDIASLRRKFKFLEDFYDQFIRSTPLRRSSQDRDHGPQAGGVREEQGSLQQTFNQPRQSGLHSIQSVLWFGQQLGQNS